MAVKSVLVVGCGYIGLPFARLARSAGCLVFATTRKRERFAELEAEGLTPIRWNVLGPDIERFAKLSPDPAIFRDRKYSEVFREYFASRNDDLPKVDAVVYAVGYDRSSGKSIEEVYVSGIVSTLLSLEGEPKVVYASSTGVYGDANGEWVDERMPVNPQDPSATACMLAEEMFQMTPRGYDKLYCILRFAGLYGPGRLVGGEAMKRGEPVAGDGEAWLNLVHQDDAAMALWRAVEHGESGEVYNVADGRPVQRKDFYSKLAELLDCPPPTFAPELARRHRGNRRIHAGKARTRLGWSPRYPSYVEGLEAIVRR
jgi:nucleoside-diphosphate-sugar epimerase